MSQFSKIIGINRSTLSHILAGRNSPSLDVLEKILENFSYIDPDWLLRGRGSMERDVILPKVNQEKRVDKIVVFYSDNSFDEFRR